MNGLITIPHYKSFTQHELTSEQQIAVHLAVTSHHNLTINALAGTGKTATLRAISHHLPRQKILYLAFNKAVQEEASTSFPRNVLARTIHSLAYRALGLSNQKWQQKFTARSTLKDYANFLKIDLRTGNAMKSIFCLREAIREFQNSADEFPSSKHIPSVELDGIKSQTERQWVAELVNEYAPRLWACMIDPEQSQFAITHDSYLKLWQLTQPQIQGPDLIMLDEAQDANPVMIDILKRQKTRLILVGDSWQQIYSFRGAVNAMEMIKSPNQCFLTQSFRFGQDLANFANRILGLRTTPKLLRGCDNRTTVIGPIRPGLKYTVIFRYNIELLEEALGLSAKNSRIHIVGSLDRIAALTVNVYHLFARQKHRIKDPRLRFFKNWDELEDNYELLDDIELKKSFRFVERYGHEIPEILSVVKKAATVSQNTCDVTLTTGHKSKGQEWENVRIADDFLDSVQSGLPEELNLLYVAITRAIARLELPSSILKHIDKLNSMKSQASLDESITDRLPLRSPISNTDQSAIF